MNKKIMKLAIAAVTCLALTGTALAAPHGGGRRPAPARQHQKAPAPRPAAHRPPARHPAPRHHAAPPPPPPRHIVHHVECHETDGWAVLGAAVIGGLVGALVN